MMIRKCDRCGVHISGSQVSGWLSFSEDGLSESSKKDLCLKCGKELRVWFKGEEDCIERVPFRSMVPSLTEDTEPYLDEPDLLVPSIEEVDNV